jgi:hypothetical protein
VKLTRIIGVLGACLIVAGCAANLQQLRAQRQDEMLAAAEQAAVAGHERQVGDTIHELLRERPDGVKALFARSAPTKRVYLEYLRHQTTLSPGSTPLSADRTRLDLAWCRDSGALAPGELQEMQDQFERAVVEANRSGSVAFDLLQASNYAVLKTPVHQALALDRTIASLRSTAMRQGQLDAIVDYLKTTNLPPAELDRIERALDGVGLRRPDLKTLQRVFPQLVERWQTKLYVRGDFKLKGGDRLIEEDLLKVFKEKFKGLEVGPDGAAGAPLRITVEKVRQDERSVPESRETVTYAQYQVDIAYAVLLMPRNASYLYEISRSGATIDYGYVVTVEGTGSPRFEKLVRGTATAEQVHCSNARVQNVFGGVQGAEWVANPDMAARCRGGNGKSLNDLREDILREVVNAAAQAPQLATLVDAE